MNAALAQDDPRLARAVEHFEKGEYAEAATLIEEVEREQEEPSNTLTLNAMAAWYKADRCGEAMEARSRVDVRVPLDPLDIEDMDRVNAYCKLKAARDFEATKEWDKALGLLAGLETRDSKLAAEIVLLREEIETKKRREAEAAKKPEEKPDKPEIVEKPIERPPEVEPASKPSWALYTGTGLLAGGVALGATTLVKWLAIDRPNTEAGYNTFAMAWCGAEKYTACNATQLENLANSPDQAEFDEFERNVAFAERINVAMGIGAGVLGAAGGGLLLYYAMSGDEAPASAAITPMLSNDAQGLVFSLQF